MKRKQTLALAAAVIGAACAFFLIPSGSADNHAVPGAVGEAGEAGASMSTQSGYVVHFDPATGKIVEPSIDSAPVEFPADWRNALSTSAEGLVEEPSPVKGGGVMVDLGGRFRSAMVAVVDEDGKVTAPCVSEPEAQLQNSSREKE